MWTMRFQYPVGQGCFHAGVVGVTDTDFAEINYVYDCGSNDQIALQFSQDLHRTRTSIVDALFVSHLDADHVSGLDRLMAMVTVDTVYLPYFDEVIVILDIMEAVQNGSLSASLIEASLEPESWFGRRGVRRVVRIGPTPEPPSDELTAPPEDSPDEPTEGPVISARDDFRKPVETLKLVEHPEPNRITPPDRNSQRSELLMAHPGMQIKVFNGHRFHNWLFLPHVTPALKERRKSFLRKVCKSLGLTPVQVPTSRILASALRDNKKREALKDCYEEIISGGSRRNHNRISMSLYSGPLRTERSWSSGLPSRGVNRQLRQRSSGGSGQLPLFQARADAFSPNLQWVPTSAVGWLGTGDAKLNVKKIRRNWETHYAPVNEHISTLLLPHHGSGRSFHREILRFPELKHCIAAAGSKLQYGHPGREVIEEVKRQNKRFHHVTQSVDSEFIEIFRS